MSNKLAVIVGTILLVIAIGFGYAIYSRKAKTEAPNQTQSGNQPTPNPTPGTNNSNTNTSGKESVDVLVAANPGSNASVDQLKVYSARVFQASSESSTLDVSGCAPTPAVLHVKLDKALVFKNNDRTSHKLVNGTALNMTVDANSSTSTKLTIVPGIYAYSCDSKVVGILLATPN